MQKTLISGVSPGSIIAQDVYGTDGVLLIKKGTAFREHYTPRFKEAGVQEILIEENGEMSTDTINAIRKSLNIQDVIHEKTRSHAHNQIKKTMMKFKLRRWD